MRVARAIIGMVLLLACAAAGAQERKVMCRPYVDQRKFHWGFMFGTQLMDIELRNNGYVDPDTGEQWTADQDSYQPGFTVGVLGEMRLNKFLALRLLPTMQFGQRHLYYHEQVSGRDSTQNLKTTYIMLPVNLKFAAPRYNNFRPYVVTGLAPAVDLSTRSTRNRALSVQPFDCFVEFGMGCDIYLPFFKFIPELKFSFGLLDILKKNRSDLTNGTLMKYTNSVDKAHSKMITLSLYFE